MSNPAPVTGRKITRTDFNDLGAVVSGLESAVDALETAPGGSLPWVNLADYLDADRTEFVTDDLPAFEAAIAALNQESPFDPGGRLIVPAGRYYCSGAITTDAAIYIIGEGSGQTGGAVSLIRFANNCDGLVLQGSGSVAEGLQLWGGNVEVNGSGAVTSYAGGDSPTGWGVKAENDFIEVRDVQCVLFGDGGFIANADGAAQANSVIFNRCQALYCGGHGFLFSGTDGNAGGTFFCSAIENAGVGFLDYSFLGNAHYSNHTRGNGTRDPTGCDKPTGTCSYDDAAWYVVAGQEAAASTTEPGTDDTIWAPFPTGAYLSMRPWVTGMEWIAAGSYATNPGNVNCYNCKFDNPYAEQAQPPAQVNYPAQVHGGLIADGNVGSAPQLLASSRCFTAGAWRTTADGSNRYSFFGAPEGLVAANTFLGHYDGTRTWRVYGDGTDIHFDRAGGIQFSWTANGLALNSGMALYNNGQQVVGARGAAVADATDAATAITQLNALLARLRTHGLIAT